MVKSRRKFSAAFKSKVALEALAERQTLAELAQKYELHPNQISAWKREVQQGAESLFDKKRGPKTAADLDKQARMFQQIGELQYELAWLKKKYEALS